MAITPGYERMRAHRRQAVLVADPDARLRVVMRRVLEGAGFEVDEAATGPLALERLHSGWFALGIVDIGLPALDGWTVLRRLREQHPTPVILMATHAGPLDVRRGLRAGAADFLVKPFGADDLAGRVSALVSPA